MFLGYVSNTFRNALKVVACKFTLFKSRKLHETTFPNIAGTTKNKVCVLYPGMQPVIENNSLSRTFYLPAIGNFLASFSNLSSNISKNLIIIKDKLY